MIESGDLEQLPNQASEAADANLSTPIAQLLGDSDDRTKSHAAHVRETAEVQNQTGTPLGDAGLTLRFKRRTVLGIHSAVNAQHNLVPNQRSLDRHDRPKSAPHDRERQSLFFAPVKCVHKCSRARFIEARLYKQ